MQLRARRAIGTLLAVAIAASAGCALPVTAWADNCDQFNLDGTASTPLQAVTLPPTRACSPRMSNGFPLPDPNCTPGAINPGLTVDVLRNPDFRTRCVRGHATTEEEKATTYEWYGIQHPAQVPFVGTQWPVG